MSKQYITRRSSLFKIILFIILATLTLIVAVIAVLFSIFGQDLYIDYKTDELLPKAKSISQQVTKLYHENADTNTVARLIRTDEYAFTDAETYVILPNGSMVTTANEEAFTASRDAVMRCFDMVIRGEAVTIPHSQAGVVVGVPVLGDASEIIGAVIIVHRTSSVHEKVDSIVLKFGLLSVAVLLLALVPSILVFRSVTRPIRHIADTALEMAKGDLDVRAEVRGSFESQHLAESFNTLAGALQSNIEYLVIERNRLSAVLNGIGEGIIAVDKNGAITHHNSSSVQLLGGSVGVSPASLPPYIEIAKLIAACLDNDLIENTVFAHLERVLSVTVTPIHEDNGVLYGAVAMIRDVTESERLEQTRRDYVANVSHELRTPLASIRSLSDALSDGLITDEADRKRYYGYIQRESIRLSHLIDDLLELSRLQSGGVAFIKGRTDLYEIAFDVADRMNETAHQRGKAVRLLAPEGEYYADTNSDRVEQVLIALTDNAIKHGEDGCTVDVKLDLCSDMNCYLFTVSNPATVDPADLDHIFERFYKADHAHSGEGTGLGLAIVAEVLNLLDESIEVDYSDGIISFAFTVSRHVSDGEHPELDCLCDRSQTLLPSEAELLDADEQDDIRDE